MRRKLEVRVSFAPTRLSATYLRTAYEQVLPVKKASISESRHASEHGQTGSTQKQHSKKGKAS
jgi:hypothetical protein